MQELGKVIAFLYPNALPREDFDVRDESDGNGPYIYAWNVKDAQGNDVAQPTEGELQAAWEALQEAEANKPLPVSDVDILGQELAMLKINNMQKDSVIQSLGQQLVTVKLEIMQLKGGA